MTKGIDVSKHNGAIDWKKVKADGIDFAMIRVGYGTAGSNPAGGTIDANFKSNMDGALAAGLDAGVYLYSYAVTPAAAMKEADFALRAIAPYKGKITYPVAFDIEDATQSGLGKALLTEITRTFCSEIKSAGYNAAFYANLDWCKNRLDTAALCRGFGLWLAQWASKPSDSFPVAMWQNSDSGKVSGISGNVDTNVCYKSYAPNAAANESEIPGMLMKILAYFQNSR